MATVTHRRSTRSTTLRWPSTTATRVNEDGDADRRRRQRRAGQRHRRRRQPADGRRWSAGPTQRHADAQRRRLVHLHARRQLQRHATASPTRPTTARPTRNVATVTHHGQPGQRRAGGRPTTATRVDEDGTLTVAGRRACWPTTPTSDGDTLTAVLVDRPGQRHADAQRRRLVHLHARTPTSTAPTASPTGPTTARPTATSPRSRSRVNAVNDAPVAVDDSYTIDEDDDADRRGCRGVLGNDTDVDGDPLTAVLVAGPANGIADAQRRRLVHLHAGRQLQRHRQLHLPGQRRHGRQQRRHGDDHRQRGQRRAGRRRRQLQRRRGRRARRRGAGRARQRHRRRRRPAHARCWSAGPANGTLTLNADGSFTYTPNANFNGTDSFTYQANDGTADSNVATVTITVNAVNDAPVASDDSYTRRRGHGRSTVAGARRARQRHRRRRRSAHARSWSAGPTQRHAHAERRRLVHLHAERQLQRHRQLHLPGQRRHGRQRTSPR